MCALRCRANWRRLLRRSGDSKTELRVPRRGGNNGPAQQRKSGPARYAGKYITRSRTLAVKIVRQPKKIALIGAPSSAAAFETGLEKAPAALRAAGLVEKLQSAGYEVGDYGDCAPRLFAQDYEHPRARNAAAVVAGLNELRLLVEQAVKSGALLLVLGGECVQAMGVVAGARRYYKHINLLWLRAHGDFNTAPTKPPRPREV